MNKKDNEAHGIVPKNYRYKKNCQSKNLREPKSYSLLFTHKSIIAFISIMLLSIVTFIVVLALPYSNKVNFTGESPLKVDEIYTKYLDSYKMDSHDGINYKIPDNLKELKPINIKYSDFETGSYTEDAIYLYSYNFQFGNETCIIYPCIRPISNAEYDIKITAYVSDYYIGAQKVELDSISVKAEKLYSGDSFNNVSIYRSLRIVDKKPIISSQINATLEYTSSIFIFLKVEVSDKYEVKYSYDNDLEQINNYFNAVGDENI